MLLSSASRPPPSVRLRRGTVALRAPLRARAEAMETKAVPVSEAEVAAVHPKTAPKPEPAPPPSKPTPSPSPAATPAEVKEHKLNKVVVTARCRFGGGVVPSFARPQLSWLTLLVPCGRCCRRAALGTWGARWCGGCGRRARR